MKNEKNKKKQSKWTVVLLVLILVAGLSLLLYPTFSEYWNSFHQSRAITSYTSTVQGLSEEEYAAIWDAARAYNDSLLERKNVYMLNEEQKILYESLLDLSDVGIMGYVEIPSIGCSLPIYHGVSEGVLQIGAGHLEWTSLPVGGKSSHCVLSSHNGLPSARLFTDLDDLVIGDTFMLHVLNETLTYQVDQITIVLPQETDELLIVEGKDYCTLFTCTPYGINSHRLLVRGHRVTTEEETVVTVSADAVKMDPRIVAPVLAAPVLLVLLILMLLPKRRNEKIGGDYVEDE